MALLQDLIQQIDDPALKERILQETNKLLKQKKFGLVFEEHLPECTPLYDVPIRVGSKVALKTGYVSDIYTVINIDGGESGAFRYSGISDVFYEGSKEQWKSICDGLEESEGITIHYNQRPATVDFVNSKLGDIETLLGGI